MIEPALAPVPPRVISPMTGESVRLDEWVADRLLTQERGLITIAGGPGSGKTSSLRHLAAVLSDRDDISFLDEPNLTEAAGLARSRVVIQSQLKCGLQPTLAVAPWSRDDVISYLLAVHRDACRSVMQRLSMTDSLVTEGLPLLWRVVLDRMAQNPNIETAAIALEEHWGEVFNEKGLRKSVIVNCLALVLDQKPDFPCLGKLDQESASMLRIDCVRREFAADGIVDELRHRRLGCLEHHWPHELIRAVAARIKEDDPAEGALLHVMQNQSRSDIRRQSMAASIIVQHRPNWKPDEHCRIKRLDGASLSRVQWPNARLMSCWLDVVDFEHADLAGASLDTASLKGANLTHANLRGASLVHVTANDARFSGADLSGAVLNDSSFSDGCFRQANMSRCRLTDARCTRADLTSVCLEGANLSRSHLAYAVMTDANLRHATMAHATMIDVDLRGADLTGANLQSASLYNSRCEDVDWQSVTMTDANLTNCEFTGSRLRNADLRGATLINAKLGEIDWEGVDLRDADLTGATFHMGSTREGLLFSPYASEGTRTGFYTDDFDEQHFKSPEEIRKANLRGADLRGAKVDGVDFYLVDLRGVQCDPEQLAHFRSCGAILD